jgi:hypothetical protein
LKTLNLAESGLTDAGLAELKDLPSLQTLYVNSIVTAQGIAELRKSLPKTKISSL